jgi:serine/threonine-protein kinase HipA
MNVHAARGKETFAFAYDASWLGSKSAVVIDPELQLFSGLQYASTGRTMFGAFMDSAPMGHFLMTTMRLLHRP